MVNRLAVVLITSKLQHDLEYRQPVEVTGFELRALGVSLGLKMSLYFKKTLKSTAAAASTRTEVGAATAALLSLAWLADALPLNAMA